MGATMWDDADKCGPNGEVYGPYIDAPVWPWSLAGWALAAFYILLTLASWITS